MKLVVFGLTLSSSWGNGHATLWRGLLRALTRTGHRAVFFERDVEYYAQHRDLRELPGVDLILYREWADAHALAAEHAGDADVVIVTSYCPDARDACALLFEGAVRALKVFYDLDTPVTLARLSTGEPVSYLPEEGLSAFDLVLSYTGGTALAELQLRLGARRVAPLYGHADPDVHRPVPPHPLYECDLSYLGTYAADRQSALDTFFLHPARRRPRSRFLIGGSGYPQDFPWLDNIWFRRHVSPPEHPAFYCSSRLTLSVTRRDMAAMGFCPSGRLFEAAACGRPILTDSWNGLGHFYTPGQEILVVHDSHDVLNALALTPADLARIAYAAHERTLDEHSSAKRATELLALLESPTVPAARRPPPSFALDANG
jgi:spore maturation protein CgeB